MKLFALFLALLMTLVALTGCSPTLSSTRSERPQGDFFSQTSQHPDSSGIMLVRKGARGEDEDPAVAVSPKRPWGDFTLTDDGTNHTGRSTPWWARVLLWVPNRVLDLIDVVRADVGVGPAVGGVVRVTEYGQVGYRMMAPLSVRFGAFGRRAPVLLEHSSEFGVGPAFIASDDREICKGEFGLGADLFLIGGYGGLCIEEAFDFVAGVFFIDLMDDDIRG